jgi:hypothetical protein
MLKNSFTCYKIFPLHHKNARTTTTTTTTQTQILGARDNMIPEEEAEEEWGCGSWRIGQWRLMK